MIIINKLYLSALSLFLLAGILFFCCWNEYCIIIPTLKNNEEKVTLITKYTATLYFFDNDAEKKETQEILRTAHTHTNIEHLLNALLLLLYDEKIIKKKIAVQSVVLSSSATAYISTDHSLFSKEDSLFHKWMIVECLLKTIRENDHKIQHVQLLVNNAYYDDFHLDLNQPWPILGFKK